MTKRTGSSLLCSINTAPTSIMVASGLTPEQARRIIRVRRVFPCGGSQGPMHRRTETVGARGQAARARCARRARHGGCEALCQVLRVGPRCS